jgi:hypothetical protein
VLDTFNGIVVGGIGTPGLPALAPMFPCTVSPQTCPVAARTSEAVPRHNAVKPNTVRSTEAVAKNDALLDLSEGISSIRPRRDAMADTAIVPP